MPPSSIYALWNLIMMLINLGLGPASYHAISDEGKYLSESM